MKTIFIAGTDTGVGKTFVSCLLLRKFNELGYKTFGIKLIASGCQDNQTDYLENDDAVLLQKSASFYQPYQVVNPISLRDPVAPHIAASNMGLKLSKKEIKKKLLSSVQYAVDVNFVEGIGGWAVPLNNSELLSEAIAELTIPVVLVVGIKLGCLNHAILSYYNIINLKTPFVGWIANCLSSDTLFPQENIQALQNWIQAPCLGVVPYNSLDIEFINIDAIQMFFSNVVSPEEKD